MKEYLIINWTTLLLVLLFGLVLGAIIKKPAKKFISKFLHKALLIKGYWKFIIPFFIIVILTYILVIQYVEESLLTLYISVLSHFVALVFAIFVGYFAFLQVVENRLDKYKEQAYKHLKAESYIRAKGNWEKACAIDPTDFDALCNLLELYLILGEYFKFDEKITLLEKEIIDAQDKTNVYYLKIANFLLQENLGVAKPLLSELIGMVKSKPESLTTFSWDFSDIKKAESYKKLKGECKKIFANFIKYLTTSLDENQKNTFEKGNYTLE